MEGENPMRGRKRTGLGAGAGAGAGGESLSMRDIIYFQHLVRHGL